MRVVTGGDWSIGLGLDSSLDSALLSTHLSEGLRAVYRDTVEQPLPAEFGPLLEQMSGGSANVSSHKSDGNSGADTD